MEWPCYGTIAKCFPLRPPSGEVDCGSSQPLGSAAGILPEVLKLLLTEHLGVEHLDQSHMLDRCLRVKGFMKGF